MTVDLGPYLFWITSRAAGVAALILASLAVSLGLLMSTGVTKRRLSDLRTTHEVLALTTLGALLIHGVSLLGDSYLHPSVWQLAIPFLEPLNRIWMALGVIAGWSLALLGGLFYLRKRIGVARWRMLHRFTALAWMLGLAHSLGEGTDAGQWWFIAMTVVVAAPAVVLLALRLAKSGTAVPARPATAAAPVRTGAARRPAAAGRPRTPAAPVAPALPPADPAPGPLWSA